MPITMIGLAYGLAGHACGLVLNSSPRVSLGYNAIQFEDNPFVTTALALGNVVIYGRSPRFAPQAFRSGSGRTLGHEEMQHTFQAEVLGPLYLPLHLVFGISSWILCGRWHGPANLLESGPHANPPTPWPSGRGTRRRAPGRVQSPR